MPAARAAALLLLAPGGAAAAACDVCASSPGAACCDPTATPPQYCPAGGGGAPAACCDCGSAACACPTAPDPISRTPAPTPAPPTARYACDTTDGCVRATAGVPLQLCQTACETAPPTPAPPLPPPPPPAPVPTPAPLTAWKCNKNDHTCVPAARGTPGSKANKILCEAKCTLPGPGPAPVQPGAHHHWDGTCFACKRFPEMANFTGRDLDWSAKGAVIPVRKENLKWEGSGSSGEWSPAGCWNCGVFAALNDAASAWFVDGHPLTELSVREVTECAPPASDHPAGNCEGGERFHYWEWMMDNGVVAEATYPWLPSPPTLGTPLRCQRSKQSPKVIPQLTGWFRLSLKGDDPVAAEAELLDAVRKVGPISVGMSSRHLHNYKGGVDNPGKSATSTTGMSKCKTGADHALNLVGYGYDPATGLDYWKIQNNWGTSWGEQGFYRLARNNNNCGVAWYAYKSTVAPKDKFRCLRDEEKCVASWSGHATLGSCDDACLKDEWSCDNGQCVRMPGGVPKATCDVACSPQPGPPAPALYTCDAGSCVVSPSGVSKALCEANCHGLG